MRNAGASRRADCLSDEQIAEFAEGLLSSVQSGEVARHIAECSTCRAIASGAVACVRTMPSASARTEGDLHLSPGERIGRYEVLEWVGSGAMGTVYAAHDPALDRKVALKLIRANAAGPELETRLLREAKAMARLSHPEVITVFDAGMHAERVYVAMEFVEGGTLREWLEAAPRTKEQILSVYQRAGRGLAQAHAAGIVHRDFKPDNVLVGADGRVRVTDFGLARAETAPISDPRPRLDSGAEPQPGAANLTQTGALVGTPVYMAPERLMGLAADARSDSYSFCVALYEALYGERPFRGTTALELFIAKSTGDVRPAPPGARVSKPIRHILLTGLRPQVEDRPHASMEELLVALERASGASTRAFRWHSPWRWANGRRSRAVALGAAAVAALAGGAAGVVSWRARAARTADEASLVFVASGRRPAVAIVGGAPFGDLLATELGTGDQIRVVPQEVTARIVGAGADLQGAPVGAMLAKLHDAADADYVVVVGSRALAGDRQRVTASIEKLPSSLASATAQVGADGDPREPAEIASRLGAQIRRLLGRTALTAEEATALRATLPKTRVAAESYSQGIACRVRYDYGCARAAFERAVATEGDFALAHVELSRVLNVLHIEKRALDEANRALETSSRLGREQRLVIEAQHAMAARDWGGASEQYRTLFGFFPDNIGYGLSYARAQVLAGKRDEAFSTLGRLRSIPRTRVEDARVDLLEAYIASKVGDIRRRREAATRAKEKADALGATWLSADARMEIAEARVGLGDVDLAASDLAEARAIFDKLGDTSNVVWFAHLEEHIAVARGDLQRAIVINDEAIPRVRGTGDLYGLGGLLTSGAILMHRAGDFRRAEAGFDEARRMYESIDDQEGVAHNTGNAAEARLALGELEGTRAAFERARAIHVRIGMRRGVAEQTLNIGRTQYFEGDFDGAARSLADALAQSRAVGAAEEVWETLMTQGDLGRARADIAGAQRAYDEAARVASDAADVNEQATTQLAQAMLAAELGRSADAVALARSALDRFVASKLPHLEAFARAVLLRALARSHALADAEVEDDALRALLPQCQLFEARFEAKLAAAALERAKGDRTTAARLSREARDLAEHAGLVPLAQEARREAEGHTAREADRSAE
jgi:tetratricopeptide (TPR) repeat protein